MKRIFFASVLIATILTGGLLGWSLWKTSLVSSKDFFESGKKYFNDKKYSEAIVQLLNAVQREPRNRDARYLLAQSYYNRGDLTSAVKELNSLLEYYPDDVEASLRLGNIYLAAGRADSSLFRRAAELARSILSKQSENVAALILSGNASAGLEDYQASVDQLGKAVDLDPANTAALVSMGASETLQKNYAAAEKAFLKAREVNPKDKSVLISLANYYRSSGQADKADAVFRDALSIDPSDKAIYTQAAGFYSQEGRFDEVEKILKEAQARSGQDPDPSLILANYYSSKNRTADARKVLLDLKSKLPKNLAVTAALALNLIQDQPDKARVEIDQLLKEDPKNPIGYILFGELQFTTGQYDAAAATFAKDFVVDSPFPQPQFFLGSIAARKGQLDEAISRYQKALGINAQYLIARTALAETFLKKGRIGDAREEIRKALQLRSDFVPARILKAALDMTDKNYQEAEKELTVLLKEQPNNPLIHRQMGLYYEVRGRTADAEKSFAQAVQISPDSEEVLRDLTMLYIRERQVDRAIQRINAVPDDKKQAFHYELLGLAYSDSEKWQEAEKWYRKALEKEPSRQSADALLFSDYMKSGRTEEGLKQLDQMIKKNPANVSAYAVKGQIYEGQGRLDQAEQNYTQALKIDPNFDGAANNLAYILAEEGRDLPTALGWAQVARKRQPDNPSTADTLGWVYYKMGNYVLALDQLKFAVSKQPDNGTFQYHLAMIYKDTKRFAEAQSALKKAIAGVNFKEKSLAQAALKEVTAAR